MEDEDPDLTEPVFLADVNKLFTDVDGDDLRFTLEVTEGGDNVTLQLVDGVLTWSWSEEDWSGDVTFSYTALDAGEDGMPGSGDDLSTTSPIYKLNVRPVNDPPFVTWTGTVIDLAYGAQAPLNYSDLFEDIEGDVLFYEWEVDDIGGLSIEEVRDITEAYHVLRITVADPKWEGTVNLTITCYDRDPVSSVEQPGVATLELLVRVYIVPIPLNLPPTAPTISGPTEAVELEEVTFDATGATDPEGTDLMYQWRVDDRVFGDWSLENRFTTTSLESGVHDLTVTVRDAEGLTNSTTVTVTVTTVEPDPQSEPSASSAIIVAGILIVIVVMAAAWYIYNRD